MGGRDQEKILDPKIKLFATCARVPWSLSATALPPISSLKTRSAPPRPHDPGAKRRDIMLIDRADEGFSSRIRSLRPPRVKSVGELLRPSCRACAKTRRWRTASPCGSSRTICAKKKKGRHFMRRADRPEPAAQQGYREGPGCKTPFDTPVAQGLPREGVEAFVAREIAPALPMNGTRRSTHFPGSCMPKAAGALGLFRLCH